MINIELNNQLKDRVDPALIKKVARVAGRSLKLKGTKAVSLVVLGDQTMKQLNRQYRGKNKTTDVLSFSYQDAEFIGAVDSYWGEIAICYPQLRRQAAEGGHSLKQEFALLLTHGLIHLCGHDHETSQKEADFFSEQQKRILNKIGFKKI